MRGGNIIFRIQNNKKLIKDKKTRREDLVDVEILPKD